MEDLTRRFKEILEQTKDIENKKWYITNEIILEHNKNINSFIQDFRNYNEQIFL